MGWVGRVLVDHRTIEWFGVGLKGTLNVTESWNGLERTLKITEPRNGWVRRVLEDHGTMDWLVLGVSFKITDSQGGMCLYRP